MNAAVCRWKWALTRKKFVWPTYLPLPDGRRHVGCCWWWRSVWWRGGSPRGEPGEEVSLRAVSRLQQAHIHERKVVPFPQSYCVFLFSVFRVTLSASVTCFHWKFLSKWPKIECEWMKRSHSDAVSRLQKKQPRWRTCIKLIKTDFNRSIKNANSNFGSSVTSLHVCVSFTLCPDDFLSTTKHISQMCFDKLKDEVFPNVLTKIILHK